MFGALFMDPTYAATLVALLSFLASVISVEAALSAAVIEIGAGVIAGNFLGLHSAPWMDFLAGFGGILLTFLAGSRGGPPDSQAPTQRELVDRRLSFLVPYLASIAYCYWVAHWTWEASLIAGCACQRPPWRWSTPSWWKPVSRIRPLAGSS